MSVTIQIKGLNKIAGKLREAEPRAWVQNAMQAAVSDVKSWIAMYPPSTSANEPNPDIPWYQRGYGTRWMREDGTRGGSRTSQMLGRRWTTRVEANGLRGIVGNNATYAPYVQDEDRQARVHEATGWRTVQGAVREKGPSVREKLNAVLERVLRR